VEMEHQRDSVQMQGELLATLLEARSFVSLLLFQADHSVVFLQFLQYPQVNRGAPAGLTAKY
jgi:hypothetical protein